jgi:hypothetical protein
MTTRDETDTVWLDQSPPTVLSIRLGPMTSIALGRRGISGDPNQRLSPLPTWVPSGAASWTSGAGPASTY